MERNIGDNTSSSGSQEKSDGSLGEKQFKNEYTGDFDENGFNADGISMNSEDRELALLGYKNQYKREFNWVSTFSFALSISGLLSTVTSTFGFPLTAGGAPAVVWCWFIGGLGCMCIAVSVAELVSAYPTSGMNI